MSDDSHIEIVQPGQLFNPSQHFYFLLLLIPLFLGFVLCWKARSIKKAKEKNWKRVSIKFMRQVSKKMSITHEGIDVDDMSTISLGSEREIPSSWL